MDDIYEAIAALGIILSRHSGRLWPDDERVLERAIVVLNNLKAQQQFRK